MSENGLSRKGLRPAGARTTTAGSLDELSVRVHASSLSGAGAGGRRGQAFDLLWVRTAAAGSRLSGHVAGVRERLVGPAGESGHVGWSYDPGTVLKAALEDPGVVEGPFGPWSRASAEMASTGRELLDEIHRARSGGTEGRRVRKAAVRIGRDRIGDLVAKARAGANGGRTTRSNPGPCTAPAWAEVMDEFGLQGVAYCPDFAMGPWWTGLLSDEYRDWRQDFVALLDHAVHVEFAYGGDGDGDTARGGRGENTRLVQELHALWDLPNLPAELQARRLHMACDMAYFDRKRHHEADLGNRLADGLTTWVHADRDSWRDFKAVDSGRFGHYLSFAEGSPGRDDMMLAGLVDDWVDLGPDLRHEECNQGVLALTRGSLRLPDLLDCYERTVWMLNAQLGQDGQVKPERYAGCVQALGTCLRQMCGHRQDLWRYYALAADLCGEAGARDLYVACQLADCYTSALEASVPPLPARLSPPRCRMPYTVRVGKEWHYGTLHVQQALRDAVYGGVLPMSVVEYELIVPKLLGDRRITPDAFLAHMDTAYCDHAAAIMRSGHASGFSRTYGSAVAALVMEQWWNGTYFAIGAGSLIEAQPGLIAAGVRAGL